ncbi:MAG: exodeoxyribonuclease VII small subunit [Kiritimatiellia bacterium]|jgi:exodeoxyribonuclease VII small subunit
MSTASMGPGFEDTLSDLEERVRKLESGEIPLDEALTLFEQGVALARTCHEQLDRAEDRVAALVNGPDGPREKPLDDPS